MAKWTKELAFEVAKRYDTLKDLYTKDGGCYNYAKKNGLLKEMVWLKRAYQILTHDSVIEESKKYNSRGEFCNNSHSHYTYARRHNMLDSMVWLIPKTNIYKNGHCIYAYVDEQNKVVYIGQTMRKAERDKEHRKEQKSSVFKYFNSLDKDIPNPIYLEHNLNDMEAQIKENYWVEQYTYMGYKLLNKAKTGLHCSSLGLCKIKWTKERVFKEAKRYKSSGEFKLCNEPAYQIACRKKWIEDIAKENGWRLRIKWNHDTCFYYASKCIDRADFKKQYQAGCKYARKHKLVDMLKFRVEKVC